MDTVPATTQDSAATSPSSVKGEDGNTPQGSGRASPPPNCAICLGTCRNKSFTDSCLHQFCFKCLLTWSKVKAVCPLCKQNFRSIIHNVRSNHQYEEYMVEQRQNEDLNDRVDIDALTNASRTFRYRTTLTLPRHESIAIQQLLLQHYPMMANVFPAPTRRRRTPSLFRRTVYRHNLWARPLPDFTGRFRDCSPEFYRYNDTQMHRLMPWLNRELLYLLDENEGHITYVMARILELLPQHHINSPEFAEQMRRYFGDRTQHFLHELYCFASTPYDMTGYDRNVQYTTDSRVSTMISEVLSSTESEASVDSDIVMISSSAPAEPPAGPSRVPAPVYPQNYIPDASANNVIPIETISHSDTDDDSEVMVVGYIKPPQDRTPEIVDLLGSDSDVIVQDTPQPETSHNSESSENRPVNLVKLSLKWQNRRTGSDSDDSNDSNYVPPSLRHRRRRRHRSGDATDSSTSSGSSTSNTSGSSSSSATSRQETSSNSSDTVSYTPSPTPTTPTPSSTSYDGATSTYSRDSSEEKRKVSKRKSKRKHSSERSKKRSKRSTSRSHHKESKVSQSNNDKFSKRKSHSGKGVKSSKKSNDCTSSSKSYTEKPQTNVEQPTASTSGTSSNKKHNSVKPHKIRRPSHESRRLKSVVQVIKSKKNTNTPCPNGNRNLSSSVQSISAKRPEALASRTPPLPLAVANNDSQSSDSEDNLPLNLTIKK